MREIQWQWEEFERLSPNMLYQLLALRAEIFVVEQRCAYQDLDGKDLTALHLMGWVPGKNALELAAVARVLFPNENGAPLSFGRIAVSPLHRRRGYGERLISEILDYLDQSAFRGEPIVIHAQYYLLDFYQKFGFHPQGEPFNEDEIKHIKMVRNSR